MLKAARKSSTLDHKGTTRASSNHYFLYFYIFLKSQIHFILGRISFKDPDENDEEIAHLQFNSSVGETEAFELSKIGR